MLVGCGGGDEPAPAEADQSPSYEELVALANSKEAEAKALAPNAPCSDTSQCKIAYFQATSGGCDGTRSYIYVEPTLSSEKFGEAVREQARYANQAYAKQPGGIPKDIVCAAVIRSPVPICKAGSCVEQ